MKSLTAKQSEIFDFISESQIINGRPPTQAEIREHFNFISLNAVRSHLLLIEKKGYLHLSKRKARGIQLVSSSTNPSPHLNNSIPILGHIAAGVPIWAEQNLDNFLPVPPDLFGGGELFALHVIGDSMTGVGIRNGDIAIIKRTNSVASGEIAAVLIDQEATLKHVYLSSKSLILKSANPSFKDLFFDRDNGGFIQILGRYQGIIRTIDNRCCA